jgi:hypothetical protein
LGSARPSSLKNKEEKGSFSPDYFTVIFPIFKFGVGFSKKTKAPKKGGEGNKLLFYFSNFLAFF